MPQPTKRKPTATQPALSLAEQAYAAKQISLDEAYTLLKIEQLVKAQPDGKFAELLVAMLSQSDESSEVMTNAEYAQAAEFGTEVARNA